MQTKTIFCANCQTETLQNLSLASKDVLGKPLAQPEIVSTCTSCNRQLKFPSTVSAPEFEQLLTDHKDNNQGQEPVDKVATAPEVLSEESLPAPVAEMLAQTPQEPDTATLAEPVEQVPGEKLVADDLSAADKATWLAAQGFPPAPAQGAEDATL